MRVESLRSGVWSSGLRVQGLGARFSGDEDLARATGCKGSGMAAFNIQDLGTAEAVDLAGRVPDLLVTKSTRVCVCVCVCA